MGRSLTGDIWGVPDPAFLGIYLFLGAAGVLLAVGLRSRIAAGDRHGARGLDSRPEDVAHLNGGPDLAVYAALSAMHVDGSVVTSARTTGQVRAGGHPGRSATALQRAIHLAARRLTPGRMLRTHDPVHVELQRIAQRLESEGLLLSEADRRRHHAAAWLPGAVALLGVVRLVVLGTTGRPVGSLFVLVLAVSVATLVLVTRAPHRTAAGEAALATVRAQHGALSPEQRPDWATVGSGAAALSVGAFGIGAMLAAEPAFAGELAAQRFATLGGVGPPSDGRVRSHRRTLQHRSAGVRPGDDVAITTFPTGYFRRFGSYTPR
ncbi:TIGR04222 domain-containing membrane protein [Pseudonocardia nantongensis]|uniref:TIGR04222 domain-containing membrane protein n=1 Tax=Pseudonocardia nantongensis TaxID=1181885 RepID=UPI003978C0E8